MGDVEYASTYQHGGLAPVAEDAPLASQGGILDGAQQRSCSPGLKYFAIAAAAVVGLGSLVALHGSNENAYQSGDFHSHKHHAESASAAADDSPSSNFDSDRRFIMHHYDRNKPFASFLPGLGGQWGYPIWAFYVNRGQGVAAFGTENKDHPIMEFEPANKAYQGTPLTGFRTFVKGKSGDESFVYEPFGERDDDEEREASGLIRDMHIGMSEFEIKEVDPALGLSTDVLYTQVPDKALGTLIRRVTFTNVQEGKHTEDMELEVLDGLARMIPFGVNEGALKSLGRTIEAWMKVYNFDTDVVAGGAGRTQPFFKLTASFADTAEVTAVDQGHFAVAFLETGDDVSLLDYVVDPAVVFGQTDMPMKFPAGFADASSLDDLMAKTQVVWGRTPSALAAAKIKLAPGESVTLTSFYGRARTQDYFLHSVVPMVTAPGFTEESRNASAELTDKLTAVVETSSGKPLFDGFVRQAWLDNLLRGGMPLLLGEPSNPKIFHTFSRVHGDLERDYNYFMLDLTFFSQGPGNYRDVNQNRRNDVIFEPRVGDFDIRVFLSLSQSDGYNPLTVGNPLFVLPDDLAHEVAGQSVEDQALLPNLTAILQRPFYPGDVFRTMAKTGIKLRIPREEFLNLAVQGADQVPSANFSQNGFWSDHWTYDMDLVDSYLEVFPDQLEQLLFDSEPLPFFMSPAIVNPRDKKYVLADEHGKVRQYDCISFNEDRQEDLADRYTEADGIWQRTIDGEVFKLPIVGKLLTLSFTKFATLDPLGMGIEMEGGKPGWNDAMNGLAGLIGSGTPETFELLRMLHFMLDSVKAVPDRVMAVHTELSHLMQAIKYHLDEYNAIVDPAGTATDEQEFTYWDGTRAALEAYRKDLEVSFSGGVDEWTAEEVQPILEAMITKVERGIARAEEMTEGDVTPTYFYYEVTSYTLVDGNSTNFADVDTKFRDDMGRPFVTANAFKVHGLPLFLEGPVRHMKVLDTVEEKRALYQAVRASTLYDAELAMYKISESLVGTSDEVGRMVAFPPGWLENESIWMHMSFKWYLELVRAGLFEEFWEELQTGIPPFMDPEVFDRSPLECASFIVSSAYPDEHIHGAGFLARLSGSTSEFLSMWQRVMLGPEPFVLDDDGELTLNLEPALPSWMFKEDNTLSFSFMGGASKVTYHNPRGLDTWDPEIGTPSKVVLGLAPEPEGRVVSLALGEYGGCAETTLELDGASVGQPYAGMMRSLVGVRTVDVYYAE